MKKFSIEKNLPDAGNILPDELQTVSPTSGGVHHYLRSSKSLLCPLALFLILLLSACNKEQAEVQAKDPIVTGDTIMNSDDGFLNAYKNESSLGQGFSWITFLELLQARAATEKYLDFDKAMKDGYEDIDVVVPNMGYHFMKSKFVNPTFDVSKPEILVYNKRLDGRFVLVAVEYAVPISVTPDKAPEGFTGSADVWERNTDFGLWLQHAWIWRFNPDGIFHDTNPLVHVH